MTNAFAKFGIEHLSPSTCNLFVSSPAMFVMQKVMKIRTSVGAAAHRGTAVEAGIAHALITGSGVAAAQEVARQEFAKLTALSTDPRIDKEQSSIAEMVKVGLDELSKYGPPTSTQGAIKHYFEGLAVPFIGFYDFEWANHGVLVDLKTTHALPSKISINHARQVALYIAARGDNLEARISYVTSKKSATYTLENGREHLKALHAIGMTIQRFLEISDDPKVLASLVVPDVDSFYFNEPVTRQQAFEIWGI